jgi:hypothetical protein
VSRFRSSPKLGTAVKLSRDVSGFAAIVAQFAQNNVTNYDGQIGINVAFAPPATDLPVKAR